ncbi:conserved hypothetical protein [Leishmania mexicana MHOM/GT/2001/U1103]|uniref:Uncharacterized protein n=1 Tax=Leishmania mexicana (strain MHOM/GT/2001/U1103) TaxID=929439 RepID=E9B514_LEIMU|nr:conserved hypothetical protein [Leishmania mexicana MHOM/GT/2001/U1103]CBZ30333.1 conserved hypothetical protein [Leishmania mexicana MHOM/GT/2001/U1103]
MVALVESWDTYLVPSSQLAFSTKASAHDHACVDQSTRAFASEASPFRYHLTDVCPVFTTSKQDSSDQGSPPTSGPNSTGTPADVPATLSSSSLLWLLTLVSRNVELLRAAAHLFLQFNAQFAALVESNAVTVNVLRARHQHQLDSLLEVTHNHAATDMIVDSAVTERVVLQQQKELDAAERRCAAAEQRLEAELQETFCRFLTTSAPDAVAAANRKQQSLDWANGGDGTGAGGSPYRAEVDVSRFAEVRKAAPSNMRRCNTAVAPFSPVRLVPVRTIKLSNEVGDASAASWTRSPSKRSQDSALQPIILDISPVSALSRCLGCCSGTQLGAIASSVSSAAEEHLLRLAHTRHSVLLFIGSEAAAMDVMQSCRAPELLLGAGHSCRDRFQTLANHPVLRVLFTTRLWGANVVLLWNPAQDAAPAAAAQAVVEDALELAYAWDADMFSVAVLEGARLPSYAGTAGVSAMTAGTSSTSAAFFASQAVSMEVLRQLRNGVTRELLDTVGTRRARRWQGTATWMQQGIGSAAAATAGTHMCPRAVGVLYVSQSAQQEQENQLQHQEVSCSSSSIRSNAASPVRGDNSIVSVTSSSFLFSPMSPAGGFRGPCITFNTPLAIRAFLPLGEEYFIREQPNLVRGPSRGGGDVHQGVSEAASSSTLNQEGGGTRGLLRRPASATATEDDDASFSSEKDARFSHASFRATSAPALSADIDAVRASGSSGEAGLLRQPEMTLESLIQDAFGALAEIL